MHPHWHNLFDRLQGRDEAPGPGLPLQAVARALAGVYGLGARARRALYAGGWLQVKHLPAQVVSVGNLTVGGTGKTPMVACLARLLQERGQKVAILSRGYGGTAKSVMRISDGHSIYNRPPEVGEEAYWLARALPGVAVYTAPQRYAAGLAAWQEFKPDFFVLDDGFQHFQLHRDLDVVLLDAESPFGNGFLLPRGPLREPLCTLAAAQVLILTRYQPDRHQDRLRFLQEKFPGKTVFTAAILPTKVFAFPEDREMSLPTLRNQSLLAFAGLARPRVFYDTLRDLGVILTGCRDFPDHYAFQNQDLERLVKEAQNLGAAALITTAKDWARLGEKWPYPLPLYVLDVEARLEEGGGERILEVLGEGAGGNHRCINNVILRERSDRRISKKRDSSPPGAAQNDKNKFCGVLSKELGGNRETVAAIEGRHGGLPHQSHGFLCHDQPLIQPLPPEVKQRFQELEVRGKWTGDPAAVQRILVRAPNWVGDAVMSLPTLTGVHALFPQAEMTVLAAPRVAPLFAGQPGVAEVVVYPSGLKRWRTLWDLRRGQTLSGPGSTMQHVGLHNSPSPGGRGVEGGGRVAVSAAMDGGHGGAPHHENFTPTPTLPPQRGGRKDLNFSVSWEVAHQKRKTENRKPRFDVGLALPNSWETALGLWLAGARVRVGYNTDARGPLLNIAVTGAQGLAGLHTVYYLLGVLQGLGGVDAFIPPRLYLQEGEVQAAAALLKRDQPDGLWVGLSPGAAYGPAKRWPPERFGALGRELQKEFNARLVLLGGPEDREAAEPVKAGLPEALDLVGRTSLRQALGVLTHLKLLITNDSGLMHAAAALGTPLIAIFGSTDPGATGPFTHRATVLRHPLPCSPCLERVCDRDYQCLLDISVAEATDAARVWLQEGL